MNKLLFLGLVFISFNIFSQTSWDLEQCIDYAIENNIQVKQQTLNTQVSENNLKQSRLNLLPNLNGNIGRNYSFGRAVDPYTNEFNYENSYNDNYGISSNVTLFKGFQKLNTIKQYNLDLKADLQDLEKVKNDISLNVATAYLNILFNEELLKIAKDQADVTKKQADRTKILVDAGSLAMGDFYDIQSQLANEELNIINAQNQLDISYLNIVQLLNIDSIDGFNISIPNTENFTETPLPVFEEVLTQSQNLPEIKSAEFRLNSAEQSLEIYKGMRYPTLNLSLSYNSGYSGNRKVIDGDPTLSAYPSGYTQSGETVYTYQPIYNYSTKPFGDQLSDNTSTNLGIQLSIPIFNNWQVNNSVSNAKISVLNTKYSLDLAKQNLEKDIQQRYTEAIASLKKHQATDITLKAMEESFKYTEEKYNNGLVNAVDYNIAKNQLISTKSDLLKAKYEYIFKIKILDFYMGKKITL
jgi:outer membrane protein